MTKLASIFLLLLGMASGWAASAAEDAPSDDLAALQRALERIGEGTPADPRADRSPAHRGLYSVVEFGAKGDGVTDDTGAFQAALDAACLDGGGIVTAPSGAFLIKTHLVIPSNVTLEGVWRKPHWGQYASGPGSTPPMTGTLLLAVEGKGDPEGTPFITLGGKAATDPRDDPTAPGVNAVLSGVSIYYPEQVRANPPHAYPWTIRGNGDDCGILNVSIVNAYQAVDFGTYPCGRHYVDGLYAYPFKTGVYVNACFDVGRLHRIHLWPFFDLDPKSPLWEYTRNHGTAFIFGRTDGEQVMDCFSIFYHVGIHLIGGPVKVSGPGEPDRFEYQGGAAAFTNVYTDVTPCAIKVDDSMEHAGYSFSNCCIMSKVDVGPRNRGPVRFSGCGFWATADLESHATLDGVGSVTFEGCHFVNWDRANQGRPCIDANARRVLITGCDFISIRPDHHKVTLGPKVREAVVTSNLMGGGVSILNNAPPYADVQIGLNAGSAIDGCIRRWTLLGPFPNPDIPGARDPGAPTRAGYDTDYLVALGGEANAALKPGTQVEAPGEDGALRTLTAVNTGTNDAARLDFARRLKTNHQTAYAYAEFQAEGEEDYQVLFGSADSAKVWVNGSLVHSIWTPGREFAPGQDTFAMRSRKGVNTILVKVENGPGKFWEFMFEARDKQGNGLDLIRPSRP